ncbi:hypothetical protein KR100_02020 [Synechococcus sp. KORDI-100]|uniref:hypothetical protein n=1 Tax=Synechococcus sp. KORDI-100 TaxID=1280380 RepID=UPI0004E07227|nr:hypothetical protein [Synechococcus sp. KORDI-100]AII42181.1 hypothetical protein KR100_02020 [Synechococcus sp. KORDI-100]
MDFQKFETFQQKSVYQPKTKITDFERENVKDVAEYLAEQAAGKMEERIQYLRQNHSGSYHLLEREDDWSRRTHYNERGKEIKFWNVYGNELNNYIEMHSKTHDFIYGDNGEDTIKGGWGDDVIVGGDFHLRGYLDRDKLMGENGKDTLIAYHDDWAYGGHGEDVLVGTGKCWLRGDFGDYPYRSRNHGNYYSDKFVLYTDTTRNRNNRAYIADFNQADQLIINFGLDRNGEQTKFGGVRPDDYHSTAFPGTTEDLMVFYDDNNKAVAEIFATDLQGFDVQVNDDNTQLVVTGSDYVQRVLTTGVELC